MKLGVLYLSECFSLLTVNVRTHAYLCSIMLLLQEGLAAVHFNTATTFCELPNLEFELACIRTVFCNGLVYFMIRTAVENENMHSNPVYSVNADEQKALLSWCLLLRFLGVMNPIVYWWYRNKFVHSSTPIKNSYILNSCHLGCRLLAMWAHHILVKDYFFLNLVHNGFIHLPKLK